jgi:hypothetical protein
MCKLYELPPGTSQKVFFTSCNTKEAQSHKILVSGKQHPKDIFLLRKLLRNTQTCQKEFLSKDTQKIVSSQETSQGTDPVGS